jgi:hypothetical protein
MLFRILNALTPAQHTQRTLEQALAGGLEPLEELFNIRISRSTIIPAPFHVLPVKAPRSAVNCRIFTERSFVLFMRDADGVFDSELALEFLERFRSRPEDVDLAQEVLIRRLEPNWLPDTGFQFDLDSYEDRVKPLLPGATALFRKDLKTILDLNLSNAEFFETSNRLLSLHFGLYMPRLASVLNPAMATLLTELAEPESTNPEVVRLLEDDDRADHPYVGSIAIRAPSIDGHRRLSKSAASRLAYERINGMDLIELHFSLLMLHRVRELAKSYLRAQMPDLDSDGLAELTSRPSELIARLQRDDEFRRFMLRAFECLAVKFVNDQLHGNLDDEDGELEKLFEAEPTAAHALKRMYELYNIQHPSSPKNNRAEKSGGGIVRSLLGRGDYGLIQKRSGVGSYFELGAGLLPLLLTLCMGARREKIKIDEFWANLARYGFHFDERDRELMLQRFKAMGLYERFSDAGEANYIRNPMVNRGTA